MLSCTLFTPFKTFLFKHQFDNLYNEQNILVHGTHTHSGPGGFAVHPLYDTTTMGFHQQNFDVIVDGIVQAVTNAHNNMSKGGRILINTGELLGANANRGAFSYLQNPADERAKYQHDVDKTMVLLRFQNEQGQDLGTVNFFAVHGTSMFNTNKLVSGDNKGYAAYLFERAVNGYSSLAGNGPFVAAFGQSNEGDVSPNTEGPYCMFPQSVYNQQCEFHHSTCAGKTEGCQGKGPAGWDMFQNTEIVGRRQFEFAYQLWKTAETPVASGPFGYVTTYIDISNITVTPQFSISGKTVNTCPGCIGDAFAAGTTDGPGAFNFIQGDNSSSNPYWNWLAGEALAKPSEEVKQCQLPKACLLYTQGITFPCPWTAHNVPLQIFQWGSMVIIGVPGEFTTMAGRRLRDTVKQAFIDTNKLLPNMTFSIAGLSGSYTHYITTFEEYSAQRYAGGSTLFGPHTLEAYQQEYYKLAVALATGQSVPMGTRPLLCNNTFNFLPPVIEDTAPLGRFGSIHKDVGASSFKLGSVVSVEFWGSDLRVNLMTNNSYVLIERKDGGVWVPVLSDADFETRLLWRRELLTRSIVTVEWHLPQQYTPVTKQGATYRIKLQAFYKPLLRDPKPYVGVSSAFTIQ